MKTMQLLRQYKCEANPSAPDVAWERLVWHAADLLRQAEIMRNTFRANRAKTAAKSTEDERQMLLFGENCD